MKKAYRKLLSAVLALLLVLSLCGCRESKKEPKDTVPVEKGAEVQKNPNQETDGQDEMIPQDDHKTTDTEETEDEGAAESGEETNEVDADLKAFLDSYEAFTDEYVEFMKKYNADPQNVTSMLMEYAEIMGKYEDFAGKLEQYDKEEMSTADAKYYLEVTSRCATKMLDIYGE